MQRCSPAMRALLRRAIFAALGSVLLLTASRATAQAPDDPPNVLRNGQAEVTSAAVEARMQALRDDPNLPEEERDTLLNLYQTAQQDLAEAARRREEANDLAVRAQAAPEQLVTIRSELDMPLPEPSIPSDAPLEGLEQELEAKEAELEVARERLRQRQEESRNRGELQAQLSRDIARLSGELEALQAQIATDPMPTSMLEEAQQTQRRAELRKTEATLEAARQHQRYLEATRELLPLQRERASRRVTHLEEYVQHLRVAITNRRREVAARLAREARDRAAETFPFLQSLALEIADLAESRVGEEGLVDRIDQAERQLHARSSELARIQREFDDIQSRVEQIGLTNTVGVLLRTNRAALPEVRELRHNIRKRDEQILELQQQRIQLNEQRERLDNIPRETERILTVVEVALPVDPSIDLEGEVRQLLETKRRLLDALIHDHNVYLAHLRELNFTEEQLRQLVVDYETFVDQNVLWIRSTNAVNYSDIPRIRDAMLWLANFEEWNAAWVQLVSNTVANVTLIVVLVLTFIPLVLWQHRLRARIRVLGEKAAKRNCDQIGITAQTFILTVIIAATWPGFLFLLGWLLSQAWEGSELGKAVADGIQMLAIQFFPLELLRHACRPRGLAEAHFDWPQRGTKLIRRHLRWLIVVLLPCVLLATLFNYHHNTEPFHNSLGRLAFVVALVASALFFERVLHPRGGVLYEWTMRHPETWIVKLGPLWYTIAVGVPIALSVFALAGYFYAAQQLAFRLQASVWFLLALVLVHGLTRRWFLVARRRLAIQQARERIAHAVRAAGEEESSSAEAPATVSMDESLPDLSELNQQSAQLLRAVILVVAFVGIYSIWVDVLPALGIFRQVTLWTTAEEVSAPASDGVPRTVIQEHRVTLADLGLAILLAALTVIGSRNIPGFIEITTLQRLPLEPSIRFAITTLARYAITIAGLVATFGVIGIGWSQVQWLAAAITLGLGFGLQEIFANFVSGIIILFERPIRVGDVVTVGDVSGTVSRIRTRATTIIDFDWKELVIPNKEFITGRVMNWTLTDTATRLTITVGVAYGSDVVRARELILQAAQEHESVMENPAPGVTFEQFADSSLNFVLRAFVPTLDKRLPVTNDLHMRINALLNEAGIEIAFPQRDIHVRTIDDALPIERLRSPRLHQETGKDETSSA